MENRKMAQTPKTQYFLYLDRIYMINGKEKPIQVGMKNPKRGKPPTFVWSKSEKITEEEAMKHKNSAKPAKSSAGGRKARKMGAQAPKKNTAPRERDRQEWEKFLNNLKTGDFLSNSALRSAFIDVLIHSYETSNATRGKGRTDRLHSAFATDINKKTGLNLTADLAGSKNKVAYPVDANKTGKKNCDMLDRNNNVIIMMKLISASLGKNSANYYNNQMSDAINIIICNPEIKVWDLDIVPNYIPVFAGEKKETISRWDITSPKIDIKQPDPLRSGYKKARISVILPEDVLKFETRREYYNWLLNNGKQIKIETKNYDKMCASLKVMENNEIIK